jgi:hypothetical protein
MKAAERAAQPNQLISTTDIHQYLLEISSFKI